MGFPIPVITPTTRYVYNDSNDALKHYPTRDIIVHLNGDILNKALM